MSDMQAAGQLDARALCVQMSGRQGGLLDGQGLFHTVIERLVFLSFMLVE